MKLTLWQTKSRGNLTSGGAMQIHRFFISLFLAVVLSACTTIGNKFDIAKVDQLQPGISTTTDAIQLLGPATSESAYQNNTRLLQWQYSQGTVVGGSGAHVAILFDATGKMLRVTHKFSTR